MLRMMQRGLFVKLKFIITSLGATASASQDLPGYNLPVASPVIKKRVPKHHKAPPPAAVNSNSAFSRRHAALLLPKYQLTNPALPLHNEAPFCKHTPAVMLPPPLPQPPHHHLGPPPAHNGCYAAPVRRRGAVVILPIAYQEGKQPRRGVSVRIRT